MKVEDYVKSSEEMTKEEQQEQYKKLAEEYAEYYKLHHTPWKKNITLGRNEPCHCGSGKKYKNCCYNKDMKEFNYTVNYV